MAEWYSSFYHNTRAQLHSMIMFRSPARLNQALIRPIHRGPTLNDTLLKLSNAHYMTIIDASQDATSCNSIKKIIILTHSFISILQVQIYQTAIWDGTSR